MVAAMHAERATPRNGKLKTQKGIETTALTFSMAPIGPPPAAAAVVRKELCSHGARVGDLGLAGFRSRRVVQAMTRWSGSRGMVTGIYLRKKEP